MRAIAAIECFPSFSHFSTSIRSRVPIVRSIPVGSPTLFFPSSLVSPQHRILSKVNALDLSGGLGTRRSSVTVAAGIIRGTLRATS